MSAYVIGNISIKNSEKWTEYRGKVPDTLSPHGGELVFRGRRSDVFSGEYPFTDTVVIRFPDLDAARNWYNSPDYQALIPLRNQAADVTLISYEA